MRRAGKVLAWLLGALVALPLLAVLVVFVGLNTDPGRHLAERLAGQLTGGIVRIAGLGGSFPAHLRIAHIAVSDSQGAWITVEDAALDWSPLALLHRVAKVERLTARQVDVARLPASSGKPSSSGGTFHLPVQVVVDHLAVERLQVAPAVAGVGAAFAATGQAQVQSLQQGEAALALHRLDGAGDYDVRGRIDPQALHATIAVHEPQGGLIEQVAKAPQLGAIAVDAQVDGPWTGAATDVAITAGQLRAAAKGTVDIRGEAANLDATANAPAMSPAPGVAWQRVALALHVSGKLAAPQGQGTLDLDGVTASGAAVGRLAARFDGDRQSIRLRAEATGVRVPGPKPDLLGNAPLTLAVTEHLDQQGHPATFALSHPLLDLTGTATSANGTTRAQAHLALPDLAPLTAAGGQDLQGHAALDLTAALHGATAEATLRGRVGVTGGPTPVPALLGPDATIDLAGARDGQAITLSRLEVNGRALRLGAHGAMSEAGVLALDWTLALPDIAALAPTVAGALQGEGHVAGPTHDLAVQARLDGEVAAKGVPRGPITVLLDAHGLPASPAGTVQATGTLDGAPLALDVVADRDAAGTLHARIARADWRSAHAEGQVALAQGAKLPTGQIALRMTRLADLDALAGTRLAGSITADAAMTEADATLKAELRDIATGNTAVGRATLDATVRDPTGQADVAAALDVSGLRAGSITGTAALTAKGPLQALALRARAALRGVAGGDLTASAAATADLPGKRATLTELQTDTHSEAVRLLAPARIDLAGGVAVDRLRLGVGGATVEVAGRASPTLDLTAAIRNVTPELLRPFAPTLHAEGRLEADATLRGTPAQPTGRIHVTATGLRELSGAGAALPPARVTADATLAGTTARVDVRADAGRNDLQLTGTAPIAAGAAMDLRARGAVDLATIDPLLSATGQRVLGRMTLDATATGTLAAPRAQGTLLLAGGDVQDYPLGAHLSAINARVEAQGETVRLASLTARAGEGTLSGSGTVGLTGTMPVDLRVQAHRARPLASDKLTATLDADLALRGALKQALAASGTVTIDRADFRIPDKLPASVPVLEVRRPGAPLPADASATPQTTAVPVNLDVTVTAPGQVFVRGRGIFAELYGRLRVGGTAAKPEPVGTFRLRRGTVDLAGQTLTFSSGSVGLNGGSISDPSLNLVATSSTSTIVATLTIGGTASAPTVKLSSVPPLPQDEVLAYLLFHQSSSTLSPLQLAGAAASLAQLSGVGGGGGGFDPLNTVRRGLGLDRLSVGGGQNGTGSAVEAGRYVARGVYAGVRQATSGQGSQATVQIDLLRGLKLEGAVGTGAPTNVTGAGSSGDPYGTSVGLTYSFQY